MEHYLTKCYQKLPIDESILSQVLFFSRLYKKRSVFLYFVLLVTFVLLGKYKEKDKWFNIKDKMS